MRAATAGAVCAMLLVAGCGSTSSLKDATCAELAASRAKTAAMARLVARERPGDTTASATSQIGVVCQKQSADFKPYQALLHDQVVVIR